VPTRSKQKFSKKKKQRAEEAMQEIADDPGMRPDLRIFKNIDDWNFVRDSD